MNNQDFLGLGINAFGITNSSFSLADNDFFNVFEELDLILTSLVPTRCLPCQHCLLLSTCSYPRTVFYSQTRAQTRPTRLSSMIVWTTRTAKSMGRILKWHAFSTQSQYWSKPTMKRATVHQINLKGKLSIVAQALQKRRKEEIGNPRSSYSQPIPEAKLNRKKESDSLKPENTR